MKRFIFLTLIEFVLVVVSATAQDVYDLSARNTEPARSHIRPYHNMVEALNGKPATSRFVAAVEAPSRSESGSVVTYTTYFPLPISWLSRQTILRIGYASTAYTVYVNGHEIGYTPIGVMGAEFNITKAAHEGLNQITITLDKSLLANKLYSLDEMDVDEIEVFSQPTIRMRDIALNLTLTEGSGGLAEFAIPIKCNSLNKKSMRLRYTLRLGDEEVLTDGYREMTLDMRREDTIRFACVLPAKALWSAKRPTLLRLDLESRIDNRIVECISRYIGARQLTVSNGNLYVNNDKVELKLVEWSEIQDPDKVTKSGYNGIVLTLDRFSEDIIEECNKRGLYVIIRTPIDTTLLGDDIRKGGNPSNDPMWNESYLWRNAHTFHSTKHNCSVVGYEIAKGKTSGINIYDTYIMMKSLSPNHLVIYGGAKGEWATDK
jgi:beta-galactosidase